MSLECRLGAGMERTKVECEQDLDSFQDDAYREYVQAAAEAERSEVFLNRDVRHAAIIVEFLFSTAKERVEILTRRLNPNVYGAPATVRAAQIFMDRAWSPPNVSE